MGLDFRVDSVVSGGLYITVTSVDAGYSTTDDIEVIIADGVGPGEPTGQWTGTMTKVGRFGATFPTSSLFYSWYDLIGQTPDPNIIPNNQTTITIQDLTVEAAAATPTSYPGEEAYFPWPGAGGGGGVACFTASSQLLTPTGYVKAHTLRTGDLLVTADGRQVPVKVYTFVHKVDKTSAPFLIPKNSLAPNVPVADLRLSPWHAISLGNGLWQKPQTAVEIKPGSVTQYDIGKNVQYYHFEAPNYFTDNFYCDGTVVESFGANQVSGKERPYTWSEKHQAYKRNDGNTILKKSASL
jgi:hypothetical protein